MSSQPKASGSGSSTRPKKSKSNSKASVKSTAFLDTSADVEIDDDAFISRKYQTVTDTLEETDLEKLQNNPNLELWAIRIPRNLTVETLDELGISLPSSGSGPSSSTFTQKGVTYSVTCADPNQSEASGVSAAAEMQSLTCLLPSQSRNGQLYPASEPFALKLVIAESPMDPTSVLKLRPNNAEDEDEQFPYGRSKRPFQPTHLLRHSFHPIGAGVAVTTGSGSIIEATPMDVDGDTAPPAKKSKRKHYEKDTPVAGAAEEPRKKEKVKKSKRTKVDEV